MPPEYQDALPFGQARGRGAGLNPGNRFDGLRLHVCGDALDELRCRNDAAGDPGTQVPTEIVSDQSRSIVNEVDSPDLPFRWTLNPYRGCEHGCIYCYARPTHELLGLSSGLDFETRIVAKHDAPSLLRRFLDRPAWRGEPIVLSGVTDCYQPIEKRLRITRRCLELCVECRQPVSIVTKNRLVTRDLDLLVALGRHRAVAVAVSVTTLDAGLARRLEPRASAPADRLRALCDLAEAGIPTFAMVAPVIPGLNDHEIPAILQAVAEAGAVRAEWVMLRLPHQVKALFLDWLQRHEPGRARAVEAYIRAARDGELSSSRFGDRMRGGGVRAEQIRRSFDVFRRRFGLDRAMPALSAADFRHPSDAGQLGLFDAGAPTG